MTELQVSLLKWFRSKEYVYWNMEGICLLKSTSLHVYFRKCKRTLIKWFIFLPSLRRPSLSMATFLRPTRTAASLVRSATLWWRQTSSGWQKPFWRLASKTLRQGKIVLRFLLWTTKLCNSKVSFTQLINTLLFCPECRYIGLVWLRYGYVKWRTTALRQ